MTANLERSESAIIIPVELPVAIERLRQRMDPAAGVGIPGHVTLLHPFMPSEALDDAVRDHLRALVGAHAAFAFSLTAVGRWPDVVYLAPEPSASFSRLIETIADAYPDFPPYGGAHDVADIVPHVTIANDPRPDWLAAAERALPAMLPVRGVAREVQVLAHAPSQHWQAVWRLPLGG